MVMDSLRYWAQSFHIDGFRFDLGSTLGREPHGFDPGSGFFDALLQDPVLSKLKLISEPWDIGPGGYQLGNHPAR
ncbi:glycogen debranching enzyme, partial [Acinetobacter baumannii]